MVAGRLLFATITLTVVMKRQGITVTIPQRKALFRVMPLQALIANTLPFLAISFGETKTSAATAGMLNALTPIATFVIALATKDNDRRSWYNYGGLILGVVGVALILQPWNTTGSGAIIGDIVVALASLSYALGFVYTKRYVVNGDIQPLAASYYQVLFGFLLSIPTLWLVSFPAHSTRTYAAAVAAIVTLGVVQTGFATLMYHRINRSLGPTASASVTYIVPLVAVISSIILLGESVNLLFVVGGLTILTSVVAITRR